MSETDLAQEEALSLISMEKHRIDDQVWIYSGLGCSLSIPLISADKKEEFLLDMSLGRINLTKRTYQNRARKSIILVRLDLGGPNHLNPDGEDIPSPHLHIYREGYGNKWAFPLPMDGFLDINDPQKLLDDFMVFCHITQPPIIEGDLFNG